MQGAVSLNSWLFFSGTEALLCLTPGPAVLFVLSHGLARGGRASLWANAGILAGNAFYFLLSALGLGTILLASHEVFAIIKYLGAAYLVYLGARTIRGSGLALQAGATRPSTEDWQTLTRGFALQAANPKALIFFAALLPQFIDVNRAVAPQVLVLGVTSVVIEFFVLAAYGYLSARAATIAREPRFVDDHESGQRRHADGGWGRGRAQHRLLTEPGLLGPGSAFSACSAFNVVVGGVFFCNERRCRSLPGVSPSFTSRVASSFPTHGTSAVPVCSPSSAFPALATTSSGFAWSLGKPDNRVSLEEALGHLRAIASGVTVPVNADFEGGFATAPAAVGANVAAATATGIAGLSIEDSTGDASNPLFDFTLAVERIRAARRAIDDSGTGILLTGRSEGFIVGRPDLAETIRRLTAYAEAGAECVYAPGIRSQGRHRGSGQRGRSDPRERPGRKRLCDRGGARRGRVRRISVGGALARAAWTGFLQAAREIAEHGTFTHLARAVPFAESELE